MAVLNQRAQRTASVGVAAEGIEIRFRPWSAALRGRGELIENSAIISRALAVVARDSVQVARLVANQIAERIRPVGQVRTKLVEYGFGPGLTAGTWGRELDAIPQG